jgi:hypothetical protein
MVKPWLFTRDMVLSELKSNKMYWLKTDLKGNPVVVFRVCNAIQLDIVRADG